jgi:hypothetical protein
MVALGMTLLAPVALALQEPPTGKIPTGVLDSTQTISSIVCVALDWIFWGLIVFAIIMFLIGGYRYATSAGDPEHVRTANKILLYATIAVVVALVAEGIPFLISSFLGSGFGGTICPGGGGGGGGSGSVSV